ncbi:MAG: hypothetical protein AB2809_12840 [Candidatus Thiodiazotropha sp.]
MKRKSPKLTLATPVGKFLTVSDYKKLRFGRRKKPSERSIRRWIAEGKLPGKKIGGRYFVDMEAEKKLLESDEIILDMIVFRAFTET